MALAGPASLRLSTLAFCARTITHLPFPRPHLGFAPVLCYLVQQHPLGGCLGAKQLLLHASPPLQASPCPCPCSLFSRAAASTRRLSRSQTAAACLPPHYRPHLGLVPVLCHLAQHPLGGLGVKQPLHVVQQLALLLSSIIGQEPDKGGKVRCDEVWGVRSVSDKRSRTAAVEEWPTLSKHTAALALACVAFGTI